MLVAVPPHPSPPHLRHLRHLSPLTFTPGPLHDPRTPLCFQPPSAARTTRRTAALCLSPRWQSWYVGSPRFMLATYCSPLVCAWETCRLCGASYALDFSACVILLCTTPHHPSSPTHTHPWRQVTFGQNFSALLWAVALGRVSILDHLLTSTGAGMDFAWARKVRHTPHVNTYPRALLCNLYM